MELEVKFVGDLQRMSLHPDDILVLSLSSKVLPDQAEVLTRHIKRLIGTDNRVVILEDGMKLEVVTPEAGK